MNDTLRDNLHNSLHELAVAAAEYVAIWLSLNHNEQLSVTLLEHANALLDASEQYDRAGAAEALSENPSA